MNTGKKRKPIMMPIYLAVAVLLAEILIWNFASLSSLLSIHQSFPDGSVQGLEYEAETGCYRVPTGEFTWEMKNIQENIYNLHLDTVPDAELSPGNVSTLSYAVSLSDEGNYYTYDLLPQTIVAGVKATEYTNLYAYGKVNDLKITFSTAENAAIRFGGIVANVWVPFSFSLLRILLTWGAALLVWGLAGGVKTTATVQPGSKRQILIVATVILSIIICFFKLSGLNPVSVRPVWTHHNQYQELAQLLSAGKVALEEKPPAVLAELENPYDTIRLQALAIDYKADYAYYNGNYYIYFGILPELLLYLPCYLLFDHHLPNYLAAWMLFGGFTMMIFALYQEIIRRWFPNTLLLHYLTVSALTVFSGGYISIIARPDMYDVPIIAASLFTAAGLFFWMRGQRIYEEVRQHGKRAAESVCLFAFGSLSMALVAACRPQMLLFSLLAVPLFRQMLFKERSLFSQRSWAQTLALCLPYVVVALGVMYYNMIRFDSPLDFGAAYSLTSNDMTRRGINMERILLGLYHFFLQPVLADPIFPFIQRNGIDTAYMGKMTSEYTYGGMLVCNAFTWILPIYLIVGKRVIKKQIGHFAAACFMISLLIAAMDVTFAGILQRYLSDFAPGVLLAAAIVWFSLLEKERLEGRSRIVARSLAAFLVLQLIYSFLIIFGGDNSGYSLQNTNPEVYYRIASWF